MLKVAFRVDAGHDIGMGHLARMSVLAEALAEQGCVCQIFTGADEPIEYDGFDMIILDSYWLSDGYIASLNDTNRLLVCYDDNALYTYECDVIVNANLHAKELDYRYLGNKPDMLLGGGYALLRKEFQQADPIQVKENANRVFICFGGTDINDFSVKALAAIQDIPGVRIELVLGGETRCDDMVKATSKNNVRIHKTPMLISEIMQECDIAVAAGGSMVYELAAMGLPSIIVTQADNQELIGEFLSRHELMHTVGSWNDISAIDIRKAAEILLRDSIRRKEESKKLTMLVNRMGSKKLAAALIVKYREKIV
jgi:spore coat polysaccharide biosynthesis predicted glycosyltransferase SpsG